MPKRKCPLCAGRKARRACPAKGVSICSVCCGTKRLIEIACPPDCVWLQSASVHPPAVVQRQRERDVHFLVALLDGLTPQQQELAYRLLALLGLERPDLPGLCDADLVEAARAMAQTSETASRGIVYQHTAQTAHARKLVEEMAAVVEKAAEEGMSVPDHDVAGIFRRIERGARDGRELLGEEGGETACIAMLRRLASAMARDADRAGGGAEDASAQTPGSGLIVPGR